MNQEFSLTEIVRTVAESDGAPGVTTSQPAKEHMVSVMRGYIANLNTYDPEFSRIFSDDYKYEDPVGAGVLASEDMARRFAPEFFTLTGAELTSPISTSFGNMAAMSFKVFAQVEDREITIDIVDVMTFSESGKITDVKAYWGAENITVIK
jgi:steroid delta-isomerase